MLPIEILVPLEPSALMATVEHFGKRLRADDWDDFGAVAVVRVGGELVVRNGNSRTYAAREAGLKAVPARFEDVSDASRKHFAEIVQLRLSKGQKGFENLPVDVDKASRNRRSAEEEKVMSDSHFWAKLQEGSGSGKSDEDTTDIASDS